jgi:hypothetical protein
MTQLEKMITEGQNKELQKRRRDLLERNKKESQTKRINERRKFVIGGLILKHFPELEQIDPRGKKSEVAARYSDIEKFIEVLATNRELFKSVKAETNHGGVSGQQGSSDSATFIARTLTQTAQTEVAQWQSIG